MSLSFPKPRISAVSYLNTVPLVWGLLEGPQRGFGELSFSVPSECATSLEQGTADVGLVPAVELLNPGLDIIPGCGIGSRGAVRSILLISRKPLSGIRTLAADAGSRTSVMLARILLAERYGCEPEVTPFPPQLDTMLGSADAALIIGDPALRLEPSRLTGHVVDLGQTWAETFGTPMVFAVWAKRSQFECPGLEKVLADSCRYGLDCLDEIVSSESEARGLEPGLVRRYLTSQIRHQLDEEDYRGMDLFLKRAVALDRLISARGD